ncbi:hypothetical protein AMATHDRAFT_48311 [Amanita thiersii Skay4041]|uniref:Crinkler effector protein N-terminal domain-containing protein n=1 Tax=Amanita thiersii Skay4041 TaxID=703135 RepID=A0A2A9NKW4_9AGAR|nr:hypothetical protein AMATHDRAFT_48311 [Amanita thiersii Skay4041]
MTTTISLFCLVYGDSFSRGFEVEIGREKSISVLREIVVQSGPSSINGARPADFDLWSVNIPISNEEGPQFPDLGQFSKLGIAEIVGEAFPNSVNLQKCHIRVIITNAFAFGGHWNCDGIYNSPPVSSQHFQTSQHDDSLDIIFSKRLAMFQDWMDTPPVCLLHSPPGSGKTTLATLLRRSLSNQGYRTAYVSMLGIGASHKNRGAFDHYWEERAGISWSECLKYGDIMYVFVDDAHHPYGFAPFFWSEIEHLTKHRFDGQLHVLLLAVHGDYDHMSCGPKYMSIRLRGLEHLRMRRREYDMLVDNFISLSAKNENIDMDIPSTVRNAIFGTTLGHPGIIRQILTLLRHQCQQGLHGTPAMLQYLVSPGFQNAMQGSSSLSWIATRRFSKDEAKSLHDALN